MVLMSAASAAEAAAQHRLNLPAGRLGDALIALGRQTGTSVGVSDPALANERVPATRGILTVEEALRRLLSGRNAGYRVIDSRTIRVVRLPPVARPRAAARVARPPARKPPPAAVRPRPTPTRVRDPEETPEIVVTASRRSVPLRSYPASVAIIDGRDPSVSGVQGSEALVSRLPTLGSTHLGPGRNKLFVRGISDSSFNGPLQATVGQYLGEARVNYSAPDPDLRLHDVERIEVLAGPQGTLHGAGSLGGIIRVVPNAPKLDRFDGKLSLAGTSTQHGDRGADGSLVLNVPLSESTLGARVSGYAVSEGGYIDDTQRGLEDVNRVRVTGGRVAFRYVPDANWSLDLAVTAQRIRGADAQFADLDSERLTRRSNISQGFANDYVLASAVATKEWEDYRFVASTAIVGQELEETFDTTRFEEPVAYDLTSTGSMVVAEARFARGQAGGSGWLAGATILSNEARQDREVRFPRSTDLRNQIRNHIVEMAVYGEVTAPLTSAINATLGGRISTDRLRSSGFNQQFGFSPTERFREAARSDTRFLPAASISAQAGADLLLYARYQQSFRPGGLAISGEEFSRVPSDTLGSFEAGMRYGIPSVGAVDLAAAVALTNWSDIQADTIDQFAETNTTSVGSAKIYTLDVSLGYRPFRGLALEAAAVFNESKLSDLAAGLASSPYPPIPGVARLNGRLAVHYSFAAADGSELRLSGAGRYTGRSNLGAGDFLRRPQGDWLDVSLLGQFRTGRHNFVLGITNLLDTDANRFALGSPLLIYQTEYVTPARPRTIRLGWEIDFD
jgi:outer membrane receptor protein involved in Fe transport